MTVAINMCLAALGAMLPIYALMLAGAYLRKQGYDDDFWHNLVRFIWEYLFPVMLFGGLASTDVRGVHFGSLAITMSKSAITVVLLLIVIKHCSGGRIKNECFTAMFQTSVRQMTYAAFAVVGVLTDHKDVFMGLSVIIFIDAIISISGAEFVFAFWSDDEANRPSMPGCTFKTQDNILKKCYALMCDIMRMFIFVLTELARDGRRVFWAILKALTSHVLIACYLGIGVALLRQYYGFGGLSSFVFPKILLKTCYMAITWITGTCTLLSMMTIGAFIQFNLRQFAYMRELRTWVPIVMKLILLPWLSVLYGLEAGLPLEDIVKLFAYLALAGSVSGYIMSVYKRRGPQQVANVLSLQIMCSLITIPINTFVLTMLFYPYINVL